MQNIWFPNCIIIIIIIIIIIVIIIIIIWMSFRHSFLFNYHL